MLSVLIVNWNTGSLLRACLNSISKFPPTEPYEVIVVDNDSTDGSTEMMRTEFPDVTLICPGRNTGYAEGNNLAFEQAQGIWLLTLNPDTEFIDNSLQLSIDELQKHPSSGCLAGKLVGVDGGVQRSVRGFPTFLGILGDITKLGNLFPTGRLGSYRLPAFDYNQEQCAPQPMGTFLLFRRQALEQVGDAKKPLDERFPIFFNEVDLLFRLNRKGWGCLYTPAVTVRHHGGEGTKQVRKSMIWESHKSLVRFLRKHYGTVWNAPGLALLGAIIYGAAFIRAKGYDAGFGT